MTFSEIDNTVRIRFKAQVATPQALTTLYDNAVQVSHAKGLTWCRFTVHTGFPIKLTCGTREYRVVGEGIAQLFGPVGLGDGALYALADAVVTAFRDLSASGIVYGLPSVVRVGQSQDEYQINVVCPFQVDTIIA